jgi:hypothetical protein
VLASTAAERDKTGLYSVRLKDAFYVFELRPAISDTDSRFPPF